MKSLQDDGVFIFYKLCKTDICATEFWLKVLKSAKENKARRGHVVVRQGTGTPLGR